MRLRAATALTGLALVSACSGSSNPTVLPTLTPTPSATAPTTLPAQAQLPTPGGAEAFVRFFFARLNDAFGESDASLIEPLIDPQCGACKGYVAALRADPDSVIKGQSFAIESVAASPIASGGSYVSVFGRVPARQLVSRDGRVLKALPDGGTFNFTVAALRTPHGWLVRAIRINK